MEDKKQKMMMSTIYVLELLSSGKNAWMVL
jgi:hypothetical protein